MNVSDAIADMAQQYAKFDIKRKHSGLPAIVHPIQVLNHCVNSFHIYDITLQLSAVYHDYLEDIPGSSVQYLYKAGYSVCDTVQELTFKYDSLIPTSKSHQKAEYISSFRNKSPRAIIIKIADRFMNTYDFTSSEDSRDYAPKYWDKAKPLFDTFLKERKNDITDYCGEKSYNIIASQIEFMNQII